MAAAPLPTRPALALAFTLVALLTALEIVGAWQSRSMALWGEAAHFIADAWAFGVAWYALTPEANRSLRSYGRGQAIALGGFVNGLMQLVIGGTIAVHAVMRLLHPEPIEGGWMLGVACLGLLINLALMGRFGGLHMHEEEAVEGARIHFVADAGLCAATVLAALWVYAGGGVRMDAVLALVAAGIMMATAWRLLRRVVHTLLSGVPQFVRMDDVLNDLMALPAVARTTHLHVWQVGRNTMGSVHLLRHSTADSAHLLCDARRIMAHHGIEHVTVQILEQDLTIDLPSNPHCGWSSPDTAPPVAASE